MSANVTAERLAAIVKAPVENVFRIPGGFSKETFLFDIVHEGGRRESLVLRRDLPAGPSQTTVVDEFEVLRAVHRAGVPAPEPISIEPDASVLGQPFLLMRRVAGSADAGGKPREVGLELARLLARLHTLDPEKLDAGFRAIPRNAAECADLLLDHWHAIWLAKKLEPAPILVRAFAWLRAHRPERVSRISVVHTDIGLHNLLVQDGRILALLDWEFARVGDPADDLGYARPHVEKLVDWREFLAEYQAHGGPPYLEENARWYEIWRSVRNAVCCTVGLAGFVSGENLQVNQALVGIGLYRKLCREIIERLGSEP
ncbi:MAG: phosphotransferase family protein [Myxococcota bacterium]